MTLGQRIQKRRKEKGLSQEDMAAMLGVSRQAVSKWENDVSYPDTENLIAISALLGCEIAELVEENTKEKTAEVPKDTKRGCYYAAKLIAALALVLAVLFFFLWQVELRREEKLENLCAASAASCLDSLLAYDQTGAEGQYLSAVSEFRCFMLSYHLLTEDSNLSGNCTYLNEVYGYMICDRDTLEENLSVLIRAMGELSSDIYSHTGHNVMYELYIALRHG